MIRRFFAYYKPYKRLFLLDFSCAVLAAIIELMFPLAVNQVVDDLLPSGNWSLILWACVGLLFIYLLNALLNYVVTYWGHKLGINIETDMRNESFQHVQKLSFRYFDNTKTGHLVSRMTNDLMDIGEMAHHGPEDLFIAIMTLLGTFGIMLAVNPKLAVMIFILVPIIMLLTIYFGKQMSAAFSQLFGDIANFNARVENNVSGIRVVQSFTNEEHEIAKFKESNDLFRWTKLRSYRIMANNSSMNYVLTKILSLFVLLAGAWFVIDGQMTYGEFIAFLLLANVLIGPIQKINAVIETYPKGIAGFKRFIEFLETKPEITDPPHALQLSHVHGEIRYENVSFSYKHDKRVLDHLNLHIRPGETIALVGPSGSGKSTICHLLPRFYERDRGRIMIDGIDIQDISLKSLRSHIGIVQQDVYLFDGTIRDNIAYGKLDATEEEIWEAARKAQLEDVIYSQADGLDTLIGERGVKLSGGQKQRIAIARMFLKNPSILILDEATSALDTETEQAVQEALDHLAQGRTTIVIAHRLATIKKADRIAVVADQRIIEEGSHDELMRRKGAYYRLYMAQFGDRASAGI
ncbi:ABC transporter ATP-binding protein [Anoxybacillus rupiensis]|uniref:ABC transporter ATP-binding protein n=1 Tax=Anoxybacteroides rupiense TaxID=311460 RepID=A0ABT5W6K5_9BACL|nr:MULTISPECIES: ABC transporter ATP-binding protein [Anoxybacillus]MBS2772246.1 ABC transporter ATP-binding protein [Anoxybacillus rupiensis]MDE8564964.1 ABC transporter ATP-binding protein [Anoxybacillus rupiensis]OQM44349.1 multidrug ABC transporter ATP-binding protein [Anoxybacillus sp. UARK-01]QHC05276.1 ATP-binding cassette domain-containing protein [Anoxybacillus sp. PDR2]